MEALYYCWGLSKNIQYSQYTQDLTLGDLGSSARRSGVSTVSSRGRASPGHKAPGLQQDSTFVGEMIQAKDDLGIANSNNW